jgi:23S rRNA (guanosine2251-2'-O)-methyltransferase
MGEPRRRRGQRTSRGRSAGGASPDATRDRPARNLLGRDGPPRKPDRKRADAEAWLYGRHAVTAALANPDRRWRRLVVLAGQITEGLRLVASARATRRGDGESAQVAEPADLAALLPAGAVHQGFALEVEPLAERKLDEVLRHAGDAAGRCILVVLDQISDPQNIGAVLRSAAAFGAFAVLVPSHGTPLVSGALAKAASGALEIVPLVRVVNLARAIDTLKDAGFWICGLDETASQCLAELDLGERIALVLGSEGSGMRRLVRERCDLLAALPTRAAQPTLNVSNAAAVALYELNRRRP